MKATDDTPTDVSAKQEPAATPLISVAELDVSDYPAVPVSPDRYGGAEVLSECIAETHHSTVDNHLQGKLGELSCAKMLDIEHSINTRVIADGGDGGVDLNFRGATIDVKTVGTHVHDPNLTVDAYKPLTADYYALVSQRGRLEFRLVGYAPWIFVANAPIREYEGELYHEVEQRYLFPFSKCLVI